MKVTAEEVKTALKKAGVTKLDCHECSLCGYPCGYLIEGEHVGYDHGCNCTSYRDVSQSSYGAIAEWVNMQSREDIAQGIWKRINGEQAA